MTATVKPMWQDDCRWPSRLLVIPGMSPVNPNVARQSEHLWESLATRSEPVEKSLPAFVVRKTNGTRRKDTRRMGRQKMTMAELDKRVTRLEQHIGILAISEVRGNNSMADLQTGLQGARDSEAALEARVQAHEARDAADKQHDAEVQADLQKQIDALRAQPSPDPSILQGLVDLKSKMDAFDIDTVVPLPPAPVDTTGGTSGSAGAPADAGGPAPAPADGTAPSSSGDSGQPA